MHEIFHTSQISQNGYPRAVEEFDQYEAEARAYEEGWWESVRSPRQSSGREGEDAVADATFEDWLTRYQEIYASPELVSAASCPNCGARDLHLVLVVRRQGDAQGWAAFWCGNCLTGVALDRVAVLPGMRTLVRGDERGTITKAIPNYRLIPP